MSGPAVTIDLEKIISNARAVTNLCAGYGVTVTGVTKVTCGMPQVAKALIMGGVSGIGESRMENIHRLRAGGILEPIMLLRIPPVSAAEEIVNSVDVSLNSELPAIRALSQAAEERGIIHRIILMLDLGDLREGFWPDDLMAAVREIIDLPGVRIQGIGTNLTCYGGVIPTRKNMQELVDWARRIEDTFGIPIETISGGNSSSLPLLASGRMPPEINHLRIGEAILLGRETINRTCWPGTVQDAFLLSGEVIELKRKPSMPIGETGQDAFGGTPEFSDKGEMLRAILNIGREDVDVSGLEPAEPGISVLGASSDHLILDVTEYPGELDLGDVITFNLSYSALLSAMTSSYVEKRPVGGDRFSPHGVRIVFLGDDPLFRNQEKWNELEKLGYAERIFIKALKPEIPELRPDKDCIIAGGTEPLTKPLYAAMAAAGDPPGMIWISPFPDFPFDLLGREDLAPPSSTTASSEPSEHKPFARVSPESLIFLCLRDAEEKDAEIIRRFRIESYTMEDVDLLGIREVTRRALRRAASGNRGVYVRFNPAAADNGRDGLTNRESHHAMEMIAASGLLRTLDISGTKPPGRRDREKLRRFIYSALGKRILGR